MDVTDWKSTLVCSKQKVICVDDFLNVAITDNDFLLFITVVIKKSRVVEY